MFSLNVDEATTLNMDKILNVLVRFFDNESNRVITQHLASRKVNIANAPNLMLELKDVMQTYGLEWRQVTSILLDNYAVMRGKKSGLETQARKENPYLLDVSGETVHMVSNAAKALMIMALISLLIFSLAVQFFSTLSTCYLSTLSTCYCLEENTLFDIVLLNKWCKA